MHVNPSPTHIQINKVDMETDQWNIISLKSLIDGDTLWWAFIFSPCSLSHQFEYLTTKYSFMYLFIFINK